MYKYDVDDYEMYLNNRMYKPRLLSSDVYVQTNKLRKLYDTSELVNNMLRKLYDTSELVNNMLTKEYLTDKEILDNRGVINAVNNVPVSRKERRKINRI